MVTYKGAQRIFVLVIGMTILLIGIAMIALPGPAFMVIPLGLAILATEFIWARVLLKKVKDKTTSVLNSIKNNNRSGK